MITNDNCKELIDMDITDKTIEYLKKAVLILQKEIDKRNKHWTANMGIGLRYTSLLSAKKVMIESRILILQSQEIRNDS